MVFITVQVLLSNPGIVYRTRQIFNFKSDYTA